MANTTATRDVYIRSDGCKAQFKCAANFDWVSRQHAEGCGMYVHWSFFESCHGKCYCDPEGGTLKNAARLHELLSRTHQLKDSYAFYQWARDGSGLPTPKGRWRRKKKIFFTFWPPSETGDRTTPVSDQRDCPPPPLAQSALDSVPR